jgi:hypothetical protein
MYNAQSLILRDQKQVQILELNEIANGSVYSQILNKLT